MLSEPLIADAERLVDFFDRSLDGREPEGGWVSTALGDESVEIYFYGFEPAQTYGRSLVARTGSGQPFKIHVIDGSACGIAPKLGWKVSDFGLKRSIIGWSDEDRTAYLLRTEEGVAVADWRARRAFIWLPSKGAVPWYERAAPFRWLFEGIAERSGRAMIHAAAIGLAGRCVLLAGRGGAGKSTLALACLGSGLDYLGDDYCLVDPKRLTCFSVYTSAKWRSDASIVPDWLRGLAPDAVEPGEAKNILFLADLKPNQLAAQARIHGIVVPSFDAGDDAVIEAIGARDALVHILPSTLIQSDASGKVTVEVVANIARNVPAWRLRMPRNLDRAVDAVKRLLRDQ